MKKIYFLLLALCFFTSVNAQIINIPDVNFKARLLASRTSNGIAKDANDMSIKIDANANGEIEVNEISNVYALNLDSSPTIYTDSDKISSLNGISNFTALKSLTCPHNSLTNLDLSNMTNLTYLYCIYNNITSLNLSGLTNLKSLYCQNNQLSSLYLGDLINLTTLSCSDNQFSTLNVSNLINLQYLQCSNNQFASLNVGGLLNLDTLNCSNNHLTSLDVSSLVNLKFFSCDKNLLTSLDASNLTHLINLTCYLNHLTSLNFSGSPNISTLYCQLNNLTSLNVSGLTVLNSLICDANQLTSLNIKNGHTSNGYTFSQNLNLQYICADDIQISDIQTKLGSYGNTNCNINSYCSFTPGGAFYTIQGSNKFDENNNGCDILDNACPSLKFNITHGSVSGNIVSNSSGNYSIPVQAGTHTITPVFENPAYFNISPSTVNVTFPSQSSPFIQNYCISSNGVHSDLEIALIPIIRARPSFDAKYKLIYKNKGTNTQSGSVNLTFNDAILDLVSSNPTVDTQTINNLSWNFTNLLPFETREITLILNVNSPSETPAVNNGDILNYTATVSSVATDETPNDNTFVFNQTVVNSLDPNDKTCLEGATISPTKVGDYVHYMIRFENNGTANAQNIVVKDMIDTNKLDISSLVPIKGSHSFVTNISSGNKVEFVFENINLPFDDANNDGYVAFKIKTKPTLVNGDTFSNTASIYFDYNFPIVTNVATTTITALSVQDFEFSNYFNVYPNPVHDVLNISAKRNIEISSVNIYNMLGQLVLVIPNAQNTKTVDVSSLKSGNYFIKINSDKGTSNTKFIKN